MGSTGSSVQAFAAAMTRLLAGDLGGTNTRLAIVSSEAGPRAPLARADFRSREHASFVELVRTFLSEARLSVDRAILGVPGPVVDGRVRATNLSWVIDAEELRTKCHLASVSLLNDVQALAYVLPHLQAEDLHTLNPGDPVSGGAKAVLAPGTGLGEAFVLWDGTRYRAYASEGGHTDFAPTDKAQIGLLQYLLTKFDHVSYERVCAGPGLPHIYAYLKESGAAEEPRWLAERLKDADDPTPIIIAAALQSPAPALCRSALDIFVSALGAEAGNLALKVLATGGIYLGGGIPRRIIAALDGRSFNATFRRKGRLGAFLARVPVFVILNPDAALLGVAAYGLDERA